MANSGWDKPPTDFGDTIKNDVVTMQRKIALQLITALVKYTPVDTGRARGNWLTSATGYIDDATENKDKGGGSAIRQNVTESKKIVFGGSIYISNNLPYIVYLENGTDKTAPFAMVERSLQLVKNAWG